jgi:metal-responsive CopG/Arc/MetJ family transcriptional regulator
VLFSKSREEQIGVVKLVYDREQRDLVFLPTDIQLENVRIIASVCRKNNGAKRCRPRARIFEAYA